MTLDQVNAHNAKVNSPAAAMLPMLAPALNAAVASHTGKRSKFGGTPCYFDRIIFPSEGERDRYKELRLLERAGEIRDLVAHPAFPLIVDGVKIGMYRADFRYIALRRILAGGLPYKAGSEIVEDFKSPPTAAKETFRRNVKHVEAQYGVAIVVVMKGGR